MCGIFSKSFNNHLQKECNEQNEITATATRNTIVTPQTDAQRIRKEQMDTKEKLEKLAKPVETFSKVIPQFVKQERKNAISPELQAVYDEIEVINKAKKDFKQYSQRQNNKVVDTSTDIVAATIFCTTDYKRFSLLGYNRPIEKANIKTLRASFKVADLSKYKPVVCDSYWNICEGQHRFLARKSMGLPIYYIICDDWKKGDLPLHNGPQATWKQEEYVHFYGSDGNDNYIRLGKFVEKHGINYEAALKITTKQPYTPKAFKAGLYQFDNEAKGERIMRVVEAMQALQDRLHKTGYNPKHHRGIAGLEVISRIQGIDLDHLVKQLEKNWGMLRNSNSGLDCAKMYVDIYNYRSSKKIAL